MKTFIVRFRKKTQNQFLRQIPTEGGTPTVVVVVGGWVEGGGGGGQSPKLADRIQKCKLLNLGW